MAVSKMDVVNIIGNLSALNAASAACGQSGVFHPDNPLLFYAENKLLSPLHEENPYQEPLQKLEDALKALHKGQPEFSQGGVTSLEESEVYSYAESFTAKLGSLNDQCTESQKTVIGLERSMEQVKHFVGLNLNLDEIRECEFIKVRFGSIPKESMAKISAYDGNPYIIFFPCSSDESHYWGVYFTPIEVSSEVDRIFASLYFERTMLAQLHSTPEAMVEDLSRQCEAEKKALLQHQADIETFWDTEEQNFAAIYSWLREHNSYFSIRKTACKYNDVFILTGWVPSENTPALFERLNAIETVECTYADAKTELTHSPPVKLKNRGPLKFFEFFVDLYGLPCYDEIDPTAFVAITYVLLFGIMFGDLGQGICLAIAGALMWKLKKMPLGKILIPCGISSAIFGTLFGSCFGYEHWLDPLYRSIFGLSEKPVEVMEPQTTNYIIFSAVGIGIALILIAMVINIFSSLRRKHYEDALFGPNGLAGLVFYASLICGFGLQILTGKKIVTLPYTLCLIILPLLVIFFREVLGGLVEHRPDAIPKKWGEFIVQNFFELFELMLSYAGNTISFLRVGAFVLVHAGMMLVVFTLADMSAGIGYVIIVMIGNAFVLALEGLLVGIQVLRLEFYEMFSRFFDGSGRPFRPVNVHDAVKINR